jgi:hypothetical protein
MADELTSQPIAPATPNEPGQSQASAPVAPQQSPGTEPGQQAPGKSSVNLYELPEFKAYQQQVSRTMSDMQRKLQEQEQRQHEAVMASMSPEQKVEYQLRLKDQRIQQYETTFARIEEEKQRQKDIEELSRSSGAPTSIFAAATSYEEAVKLALEYARQNSPQAQAVQQQRLEANRVDLGTGGASTPEDRKRSAMRDELAKGNALAYYKMLLED